MKVSIKFVLYIIFLLCSNELISAEIVDFRFGSNAEIKRIVLDLNEDVTFSNKKFKKKIEIKFDKNISIKNPLKKNNHLASIKLDENLKILTLNFKKVIHNPNIYFLKKKKNKHSRIVIDYLNKIEKKKL